MSKTGGDESLPFSNHSISIHSYQTKEVFPSNTIPAAYHQSTSDREINAYEVERHYTRIHFTADIKLSMEDNKGYATT